ncbi:MAG: hypothetical protein NVS3B5_23790 [Sphingomicrobium sp.]
MRDGGQHKHVESLECVRDRGSFRDAVNADAIQTTCPSLFLERAFVLGMRQAQCATDT